MVKNTSPVEDTEDTEMPNTVISPNQCLWHRAFLLKLWMMPSKRLKKTKYSVLTCGRNLSTMNINSPMKLRDFVCLKHCMMDTWKMETLKSFMENIILRFHWNLQPFSEGYPEMQLHCRIIGLVMPHQKWPQWPKDCRLSQECQLLPRKEAFTELQWLLLLQNEPSRI